MSEPRVLGPDVKTAHQDLHSERGALRGERPGRSRNPVIKVADLAWLEFEKPDLDRAEVFARDFGFGVAARTERELWLRGTFAGSPCMGARTLLHGVRIVGGDRVRPRPRRNGRRDGP